MFAEWYDVVHIDHKPISVFFPIIDNKKKTVVVFSFLQEYKL